MPPKPWPRMGPSPTPITEYLALHPEASMMSIAKACGVHYDTIHKAERGEAPPLYVTMLKLEKYVGIPVSAWAGTRCVQIRMERRVSPDAYTSKQERWRKKKRAEDPAYKAREDEKFKRHHERERRRRHGEVVPPLPPSPLLVRLKGAPSNG